MDTFMATMWAQIRNMSGDLQTGNLLLTIRFLSSRFQSLLSIRQDDKVVCPRTKEVFNFSQAEKVYIMWWLRAVWAFDVINPPPASHPSPVDWPVEPWFPPSSSRVTILPVHDQPEVAGSPPGPVSDVAKQQMLEHLSNMDFSELSLFYMSFLWGLETTEEETGQNPAW